MVVNAPPYDIRGWLYPGGNPIDVSSWGLPVDISSYIRYPGNDGGQAITYSAGRQDEAAQVDAGTLSMTLDNRDGRFSTHNPLGPYYGLLDRNTPFRLGMTTCRDSFTRTTSPGDLGTADTQNTWSATATWRCTGAVATANLASAPLISYVTNLGGSMLDGQVEVDVIPNATATGAVYQGGILCRRTDNANQWAIRLEFNTAGTVTLKMAKYIAGGYIEPAVLDPIPASTYSAGVAWRLAVLIDGGKIYASAWPKAGTQPTAWMLSADTPDPELQGRIIGISASRTSGNTNTTDQVSFDNFQSTGFEFTGTIVQWPVDWDMTGNNCWAAVQGAGILRRLQQGNAPLKSPLTRQLPAYGPTAYWPLEDVSGAASLASALSFGVPATFQGNVVVGGSAGPAGGGTAVSLGDSTGMIRGSVGRRSMPASVKGFSAMIFTKFDSLPATDTPVVRWFTNGTSKSWVFSIDATGCTMRAYDQDGIVLSSASNLFPAGLDLSEWVAWQLETDVPVIPGVTTWSFVSHQVGKTSYAAQSGGLVGTATTSCTGFAINPNYALPAGTAFAHAWIGPNTLPFVTDSFSLVSSGYSGELASDRAARLCAEEGIPIVIEPGVSEPMGPQPIATILDALRQCQDTDQGILYERGAGLGFRPHTARYLMPVTLALDVASAHLASPPRPINDDQQVRNSWTVSRINGSSVTAQDDTSISKVGLYADGISISIRDDDLLQWHAGWRLYLGTRNVLRWPGLQISPARVPSLAQIWRGRQYGFRMTVTTNLAQVLGNDPDVIVEGHQGVLWPHGWTLTLNCSSAKPWDITTLDDALTRLDSASSTLVSGVNSSAVSLSVATTADDAPWVTTAGQPAEFPFNINVNGEIMTVTAIVNAASPQTFTVDRGVGGFSKDHAADSVVSLATPTYLAL
jgi:hypothetical protein